jgi:hypothetical protein
MHTHTKLILEERAAALEQSIQSQLGYRLNLVQDLETVDANIADMSASLHELRDDLFKAELELLTVVYFDQVFTHAASR